MSKYQNIEFDDIAVGDLIQRKTQFASRFSNAYRVTEIVTTQVGENSWTVIYCHGLTGMFKHYETNSTFRKLITT